MSAQLRSPTSNKCSTTVESYRRDNCHKKCYKAMCDKIPQKLNNVKRHSQSPPFQNKYIFWRLTDPQLKWGYG